MTEETIEDFRKKHFENYKNAVLETLKNNTTALFMDDILSLLQKPPLDSMDIIKCKFLDLAKKYNTIIQSETLNRLLEEYRNDIISYISEWEVIRIKELKAIIEKFVPKKETDVIKFNKKDFTPLNRKLKKKMKADIMVILNKKIVNNVNSLFTDDLDEKIEKNLSTEMIKFIQTTYIKQLLENIDFKIIVKDTTLINGVREQGERFIFTKMNSHLLNDDKIC
ncbi:MAG TPA: hypothetical protein IAB35_04965 [Candidatus Faecimonas gallistercoris]|nr:hypothetical protein [Candidatus Faecimonas gallistercoris]